MSLPETDGPLRGWLRARPDISAACADRVYFGEPPRQDRPTLPFLVFYRVGGLPDHMSTDHPDFIIEVWGENKHQASTLASKVAGTIMDSQHERPVIIDGVKISMGDINLGPVPSSGVSWAKRYRIDASFHMHTV